MSNSASSNDSVYQSYHDELPFQFRIQDDDIDVSQDIDAIVNDYDDGFNWATTEEEIVQQFGTPMGVPRLSQSGLMGEKLEKNFDGDMDENDLVERVDGLNVGAGCDFSVQSQMISSSAAHQSGELQTHASEHPTFTLQSQQMSTSSNELISGACDLTTPTQMIPTANTNPSADQAPPSAKLPNKQPGISSEQLDSHQQTTFIPHKGALKRIINSQTKNSESSPKTLDPSIWPIYSITVSFEPLSPDTTNTQLQPPQPQQSQYQVLYSRTQYEQCIKLFTLLDTECVSSLGPECLRDFVWRYCPVVRRRDDALLTLNDDNTGEADKGNVESDGRAQEGELNSPTFTEIWNVVITSDPDHQQQNSSHNTRLGLESFLLFTRLLSLSSHLESRRRFASRHLQQMMRHKYNNISPRLNPNEVVVVVDNPPPGPPLPISVRALMEVELELGRDTTKVLVENWPYGSLDAMELDLDQAVVRLCDERHWNERRRVMIEPFSDVVEGDFILRYSCGNLQNDVKSTVVRRSYADFCWLNEILIKQKRPGHGHLCGRILPPFPPRAAQSGNIQYSAPRPKDVSERAVAAAKSGVGMITSVAKSLWGNYIAPTAALGISSSPTTKKKESKVHYSWSGVGSREDSCAQLARRMDRYLNYLLENQALSTSFPLNAVLMASQSGLECSKQILNDYAKQKKRRRTNQAPISTHGNTSAYAILSTLLAKKPSSYFNSSDGDDTPWLRIAARTAMSLQFHGILETTGHESTSAKIQHASLPKFGVSASSWDEDETDNIKSPEKPSRQRHDSVEGDFEEGVIRIESELIGEDDIGGYDLLPSPGPSEEHHVLNATNSACSVSDENSGSPSRARFVYGAANANDGSPGVTYEHSAEAVTLGSVKVDSDIDKLKTIIKSMDRILKRLHKSSAIIESAQTTRSALRLDLLKDIDSFGDSRGGVISQRSLVDGVAALGNSSNALNLSNGNISDDLGWQSALASSAVGATREVKEAVVASRTASRAKNAAFTAAAKSKKHYESLDSSSSREEINSAQSEASATQSHAIHATVVEYEANIAKKRAAVSLAQDVKCWNAYRKRELRQSCLEYAKSQRDACRKAADAWESLRDGLIDSSTHLFAPGELMQVLSEQTQIADADDTLISSGITNCSLLDESGISYTDRSKQLYSSGVDANVSSLGGENTSDAGDQVIQNESTSAIESIHASTSATSLPEAFVDIAELTTNAFELDDSVDNVYLIQPPDMSNLDDDHFALQQDIISAAESSSQGEDEAMDTCAFQSDDLGIESVLDRKEEDDQYTSNLSGENNMTTSMQSLIDGLMAWGGEEEEPINDIGYQADGVVRGMKTNTLLE